MSTFAYKGLEIEAALSKKVPATWLDPPEGGDLESLEWWVDDMDEVCAELNIREPIAKMLGALYYRTGVIPVRLKDRIEAAIDIEAAAYEHHAENGDDE